MQGKTILIIDDEEQLTDMLKLHLEHKGYRVITAYDGRTGLKMAKEQAPDLLILDINLPKLSGIEVYKSLIAKGEDKPRMPVVILTCRSELEDFFDDIRADCFINKPFEFEDLQNTIERLLTHKALPVIFVIDEVDSDYAKDIRKAFKYIGFHVEIIDTPESFTKAMSAQRPDFILMEYMQRHATAQAFIDQIRSKSDLASAAKGAAAECPIVVYSHSGMDYRDRSLKAGANVYVSRPDDPKELVSILTDLYGTKTAKTDLRDTPVVLLVDLPSAPHTRKIDDLITGAGFFVKVVDSMAMFKMAVADRRPDMVVMEYMQPDMSGEHFIRQAKEVLGTSGKSDMKKASKIPILVYTHTAPGPYYKEDSIKAGADRYIGKPANGKAAVEALKEYLLDQEEEAQKRDRLRQTLSVDKDQDHGFGGLEGWKEFFGLK